MENILYKDVEIPDGYEIDVIHSTIFKTAFKPIKTPINYDNIKTYDDILNLAINNDNAAYVLGHSDKIDAINKLLITAKVLNDGWVPDWNNPKEAKYYIYFDSIKNTIEYGYTYNHTVYCYGIGYFKDIFTLRKTIEILGDDLIKTALY